MKKKVIILSLALMMLVVGVVSAAASWGKFEGYNIVRIQMDGKTIKETDTPAVILKGRTMLPIYMLKEAGIQYEWDGDTTTVNVKSQVKENNVFDPTAATKEIMKLGGAGITITSLQDETTAIVYYEQRKNFDSDWLSIDGIFKKMIDFNATYSRVEYGVNGQTQGVIEIRTKNYQDFMNFVITESQLQPLWMLSGPMFADFNRNQRNSNSEYTNTKTVPELYSNDLKTYLGKLTTNAFDIDSIFNTFGTYGSKFSTDGIWNEFGTYGSEFSNESVNNQFATKPPAIVLNGAVLGYVTSNTTIKHGVTPDNLKGFLENLGY